MSVKICGAVTEKQIAFLDEYGVDYVGIWFGIPKGKHNLSESEILNLTKTKPKHIKPVLVTLLDDAESLSTLLSTGFFHAVQLHGFSLPQKIKQLRQECKQAIKIFKVLHVNNNQCLEERLVKPYIAAGVDAFILDSFQDKEAIGSTGVTIDPDTLDRFFSRHPIEESTMIAGGIGSHNIDAIYQKFNILGVDIDSAARVHGDISRQRVMEIMSIKNAQKDAYIN